MNIGCLFGTFDPPHLGHLTMARHALELTDIERVWFVLTPLNPFKTDRKIGPDKDRIDMLKATLQDVPHLDICLEEFALPAPNYTVDTLAHFRQRWPEHCFSLIMGSDNLLQFAHWRQPEEILAHHRLIVHPRPGHVLQERLSPFAKDPRVLLLDAPEVDVSSTLVRRTVREGGDADRWLAPGVARLIRERGLYKE
ncbi:MAG: nicotinate (nicotinamide) nucleotide adenylyltransferase [Flavobacteriales bacterium]|nr:nicotinate (nicotinamide) nucleotide adenylyltransferase [Flavobacteriales bacterium]MCB9193935.1 nicotinate (nicotinamide) nucleotide adenylyltransferase [Flavobacteriales bacterium]